MAADVYTQPGFGTSGFFNSGVINTTSNTVPLDSGNNISPTYVSNTYSTANPADNGTGSDTGTSSMSPFNNWQYWLLIAAIGYVIWKEF